MCSSARMLPLAALGCSSRGRHHLQKLFPPSSSRPGRRSAAPGVVRTVVSPFVTASVRVPEAHVIAFAIPSESLGCYFWRVSPDDLTIG